MARIVRVGEPLRDTDTNLTSGHLENVDLRGRDLTGRKAHDLSIINSDVTDLRLPDDAGWVYIRYCTGLMLPRRVPDKFNHHEVASIFLRWANARRGRQAEMITDVGTWVMTNPRASWHPTPAIYYEKYDPRAFDRAMKAALGEWPALLERWEWAKSMSLDPALIPDNPLDLGPGGVIQRRDDGVLMIHRKGALPKFALPPAVNPHDRYAVARALETYARRFIGASGGRLVLYIESLEPLSIKQEIV